MKWGCWLPKAEGLCGKGCKFCNYNVIDEER